MTDKPPYRQLESDDDRLIFSADFPQLTPIELFDYWTRPELLTRWWPQEAEIDPEVGGRYHLLWREAGWALRGEITEYVPGEKFAFTWKWEHMPDVPARLVEVRLAPDGDGTRLQLEHSAYTDSNQDQHERDGHIQGWNHCLGSLTEQVAATAAEEQSNRPSI